MDDGRTVSQHDICVAFIVFFRGIVHSEMPGQQMTRGLQLWVNLAKEFKMIEPSYQEHTNEQIPKAEKGGVKVKGEPV